MAVCREPGMGRNKTSGNVPGRRPVCETGGFAASNPSRRHDVSILIGVGAGVGRYVGSQPRAKTSMMIMRAPQRGQGHGSTRGSSGGGDVVVVEPDDDAARSEQFACAGDVGGTVAVGEQAVVADAVEALGQHVDQEAADELVSGERHGLPPVRSVDAVILPAEGDAVVVDRDQTAIGDGDAVGIPGEIAQHLLGPRRFWCDYPFAFAQRRQESLERSSVGRPRGRRRTSTTLRVDLDQHGQEPPPEQARQHVDVHEEARAAGDPSRAIL